MSQSGRWTDLRTGLGRWTKRQTPPSKQTFEFKSGETAIIDTNIDTTGIKQQLEHANQQLELQSQYPGRNQGK
jgi:hypothetical protein